MERCYINDQVKLRLLQAAGELKMLKDNLETKEFRTVRVHIELALQGIEEVLEAAKEL